MGLLSALDVMLDRPMAEVLRSLPIANDAKLALLSGSGKLGALRRLVVHYELADWDGVDGYAQSLGLAPQRVAAAYGDALRWTDRIKL